MNDPCLIWCHGSLAVPWGNKSRSLADTARRFGLVMEAVDFQDLDDPDQRVGRLEAKLDKEGRPAILAGSSMGGYVAAAAAARAEVRGLFVLAPAFYLQGYALQDFASLPESVAVVHGWRDEVVPVSNAIRFARHHAAALHVFDDDHRLADSLGGINALFARFLETVLTRKEQ
jgi:pimeloyl-ACP methyl ester carboxylesterase